MRKAFNVVAIAVAASVFTACGDDDRPDGSPRVDTTRPGQDQPTTGASRQREASEVGFACDPADANRPDKPRKEVAGSTAPAVPRRTCTLPRLGCATAPGQQGVAAPPPPGVDVVRVTKTAIDVAYDLGRDLSECRPVLLRTSVYTTASGLSPFGDDHPVSGRTGRLRIELRKLPVDTDYGPPDLLFVSAYTEHGRSSESASVGLPPPEGGRRLSRAEVRRIERRREACRADIDDRTYCESGGLHPVSGPVTEATRAQFTRSVRRSLEAYGGFTIRTLTCTGGTRCDATFALGHGRRLEMSYGIEALKSSPTCWELTAFRVVRPVPELGGFAAPLPNQGCVDR